MASRGVRQINANYSDTGWDSLLCRERLVRRRLDRSVAGSVDRFENDWLWGVVCSPGVRSQNGGGAKRVMREKEGDTETITRSDIPRRTMRCNSLYPVEGEPPPILATKRCRLNSRDRSHYLHPRSLWRCGRRAPTRIIFIDSGASIAFTASSTDTRLYKVSRRKMPVGRRCHFINISLIFP